MSESDQAHFPPLTIEAGGDHAPEFEVGFSAGDQGQEQAYQGDRASNLYTFYRKLDKQPHSVLPALSVTHR